MSASVVLVLGGRTGTEFQGGKDIKHCESQFPPVAGQGWPSNMQPNLLELGDLCVLDVGVIDLLESN